MPRPQLNRDALVAGARFLVAQADRLDPMDARFARGMSMLLDDGRALSERQQNKLVLLVDQLLES